jgi:putative transposase
MLTARQNTTCTAIIGSTEMPRVRASPQAGIERFRADYGAKYPKAVESLVRDQEKLLTFFDFPAEHWKHLRTTNPIESSFATVRLRQNVTTDAGSRMRGLVFAYKLLDMAQQRWRKLDGSALLPLVRAGVEFKDGAQVERQDQPLRKEAARSAPIHNI